MFVTKLTALLFECKHLKIISDYWLIVRTSSISYQIMIVLSFLNLFAEFHYGNITLVSWRLKFPSQLDCVFIILFINKENIQAPY